jgi:anti-sigma regulatory factor (Ser/Thr protein kinase)
MTSVARVAVPEPTPAASSRTEAASAQTEAAAIRLRLTLTSPSASILRTELADWLRHLGTAGSTIFDLQLACTEVLTIMIGQPGHRSALVMELEGTMTDKTITVTMRECGLCRQPGHPPATLDQELSLNLIEAMTDTLEINANTQGRTFTLQRRT